MLTAFDDRANEAAYFPGLLDASERRQGGRERLGSMIDLEHAMA